MGSETKQRPCGCRGPSRSKGWQHTEPSQCWCPDTTQEKQTRRSSRSPLERSGCSSRLFQRGTHGMHVRRG
eukprot:12054824-Prorocentrum_lima.AAC.1